MKPRDLIFPILMIVAFFLIVVAAFNWHDAHYGWMFASLVGAIVLIVASEGVES